MPRTIDADLQTYLSGTELVLAYLLEIERKDSVTYRFTSFGSDIVIDGDTYYSAPGIDPSAVSTSLGTGIDNSEITAIIDSATLKEQDILQGKFDGAEVRILLMTPDDPTIPALLLMRGFVGELTLEGQQFKGELRGLLQKASQKIGIVTSELCRVEQFCDGECGLSEATYRSTGTVTEVVNAMRLKVTVGTNPSADYYAGGKVLFTSGVNDDIFVEIVASTTTGYIDLAEPLFLLPTLGDTVTVTRGCDRTFAACQGYNNTVNFRGEPYIPGTDRLLSKNV